MVCVAVTRGGAGSLWRFASLTEADDHPIVQYGDAVVCSPEDVLRTFRDTEMAALAERAGQPRLRDALRAWAPGAASRRDREAYAEQLWSAMQKSASPPPRDPSEIVRLVREDRVAARSAPQVYRLHPTERRDKMTDATTTETTKKAPPTRQPKFAGSTVISLGTDKEGAKFGPSNNPKKAGSKSAERFALYEDGMTVDQAVEKGITRADIDNDQAKGLITLA